ncbi:MAG: acyl-CoA dehydrogenase family protein [Rhodanobacteraceae bacterium]
MGFDVAITDTFRRWVEAEYPSARVRELENRNGVAAAWLALEESGFCDTLVAEEQGGAGAALETIAQMLFDVARCAAPLPLGATLWVRAACAAQDIEAPSGPIAIAPGLREGEQIRCVNVELGSIAAHVLVVVEQEAWLLPVATAECRTDGLHASLNADLGWLRVPHDCVSIRGVEDWRLVGAALFAAQIAGAADRALELTVAYAGTRTQFGRPIGKFQALQQRLAVMAEDCLAARMAVQLAWRGEGLALEPAAVAVAKGRCSALVPGIAAVAHLVHGAIGIAEEYDLQLFTRRLYDWRMQFGSETYWYRELGRDVLARSEPVLATLRRWTDAD